MRESRGKKDEKRSGRARPKAEWVQWQSAQVQCSRTNGQTPDASSITSYGTVPQRTVMHCP